MACVYAYATSMLRTCVWLDALLERAFRLWREQTACPFVGSTTDLLSESCTSGSWLKLDTTWDVRGHQIGHTVPQLPDPCPPVCKRLTVPWPVVLSSQTCTCTRPHTPIQRVASFCQENLCSPHPPTARRTARPCPWTSGRTVRGCSYSCSSSATAPSPATSRSCPVRRSHEPGRILHLVRLSSSDTQCC